MKPDQPTTSLQAAQYILEEIFPKNNGENENTVMQSRNKQNTDTRNDPPFSIQEINRIIDKLNVKKAPGPDGITNALIKSIHAFHKFFFPTLFNKCLSFNIFPTAFKKGQLILFLKPGKDPNNISSYRPIILLNTIGKILEKLLTQRINYYIEKTKWISDKQHGFRRGYSTETALSKIHDSIQTFKSQKQDVALISIYIKGAFNNVSHKTIVKQ